MNSTEIMNLLGWADLLQILALIYAGIEFLSSRGTLKYLFKESRIRKLTVPVVVSIIVFNLISFIAPPFKDSLSFEVIPKFLSSDIFFKIISLMLLTGLIVDYFVYTIYPNRLYKQLKYNPRKPRKFFLSIYGLTKYWNSDNGENYHIVSNLLFSDNNFVKIVRHLKSSSSQGEESEERKYADELINKTLIDQGFIKYLGAKDKLSCLALLETIKEEEAVGCRQFIRRLSAYLIAQKSFLDTEIDDLSEGVYPELTNVLYRDSFFYTNFQLFDLAFEKHESTVKTVHKLRHVLEVGVKDYYQEETNQYRSEIQNPFYFGLDYLTNRFENIIFSIRKMDSPFGSKFQEEEIKILSFFGQLPYSMKSIPDEGHEVKMVTEEQTLGERSLMLNIIESIFKILDYVSYLDGKDGQEYARHTALELDWLWDNIDGLPNDLFKNIKKKIFILFEERIEENLKGFYPPLIRTLLSSQGGKDALTEIFKNKKDKIRKCLENEEDKKRIIPIGWTLNKDGDWEDTNGVVRLILSNGKNAKTQRA